MKLTIDERSEVIKAVEILLDEADGDPEVALATVRGDEKEGFSDDVISLFCKVIDFVLKKRSVTHAK